MESSGPPPAWLISPAAAAAGLTGRGVGSVVFGPRVPGLVGLQSCFVLSLNTNLERASEQWHKAGQGKRGT